MHESDHRELINIQLSQSDLEEKCRRVLELWARRSNSRWEDVILQLRETVGLSRLADELIKELDRSEDRSQPSAAGNHYSYSTDIALLAISWPPCSIHA